MQWIITKDHLEDQPSENSVNAAWFVVANMPPGFTKKLVDDLPYEFRLFDDDGELYYSGKCGDLEQADSDHAFAPLDWAENEAGCTRMDYRKKGVGRWQTL